MYQTETIQYCIYILYRPTLSVTTEYMLVTTVQVFRVNVW